MLLRYIIVDGLYVCFCELLSISEVNSWHKLLMLFVVYTEL